MVWKRELRISKYGGLLGYSRVESMFFFSGGSSCWFSGASKMNPESSAITNLTSESKQDPIIPSYQMWFQFHLFVADLKTSPWERTWTSWTRYLQPPCMCDIPIAFQKLQMAIISRASFRCNLGFSSMTGVSLSNESSDQSSKPSILLIYTYSQWHLRKNIQKSSTTNKDGKVVS